MKSTTERCKPTVQGAGCHVPAAEVDQAGHQLSTTSYRNEPAVDPMATGSDTITRMNTGLPKLSVPQTTTAGDDHSNVARLGGDLSKQLPITASKRTAARNRNRRNKALRKAGVIPPLPTSSQDLVTAVKRDRSDDCPGDNVPRQHEMYVKWAESCADAARMDLDVVILDMGHEDDSLKEDQVAFIKRSIIHAVMERHVQLGFFPLFEAACLMDDSFIVKCRDQRTKEWLISFIASFVAPWEGAQLKAVSRVKALNMPKMRATDESMKNKEIFATLFHSTPKIQKVGCPEPAAEGDQSTTSKRNEPEVDHMASGLDTTGRMDTCLPKPTAPSARTIKRKLRRQQTRDEYALKPDRTRPLKPTHNSYSNNFSDITPPPMLVKQCDTPAVRIVPSSCINPIPSDHIFKTPTTGTTPLHPRKTHFGTEESRPTARHAALFPWERFPPSTSLTNPISGSINRFFIDKYNSLNLLSSTSYEHFHQPNRISFHPPPPKPFEIPLEKFIPKHLLATRAESENGTEYSRALRPTTTTEYKCRKLLSSFPLDVSARSTSKTVPPTGSSEITVPCSTFIGTKIICCPQDEKLPQSPLEGSLRSGAQALYLSFDVDADELVGSSLQELRPVASETKTRPSRTNATESANIDETEGVHGARGERETSNDPTKQASSRTIARPKRRRDNAVRRGGILHVDTQRDTSANKRRADAPSDGKCSQPDGPVVKRSKNSNLDLFVLDMGHEDDAMTVDKVEQVKQLIGEAVDENHAKIGFFPLFEAAGLVEGNFRVTCRDHETRDWLVGFIPTMDQPWEGAKLKAVPREALKLPRVCVFLPCQVPIPNEKLVASLVGRNKVLEVAIEMWRLVRSTWVERKNGKAGSQGHFVIFRLPQVSLDLLLAKRPSLYWMMQRVTVKRYGPKDEAVGGRRYSAPSPSVCRTAANQ